MLPQSTSNISLLRYINTEKVRKKIRVSIDFHDALLSIVKKRKTRWYGLVWQDRGKAQLKGSEGGVVSRRYGKIISRNFLSFASLQRAEHWSKCREAIAMLSVVPQWQTRLWDWNEVKWIKNNSVSLRSKRLRDWFHCVTIKFLYMCNVKYSGVSPRLQVWLKGKCAGEVILKYKIIFCKSVCLMFWSQFLWLS